VEHPLDIVVIGAGAAGLATAIFARRANPARRVVLVDGARRPGAKILVSGGSRCNVTNARVTDADFHGGSRSAIKQVLRSLPVSDTVEFFAGLGVPLHEEVGGKLFPDSNRSRDVLEALLRAAERVGAERMDSCRVHGVSKEDDAFVLRTDAGVMRARRVVLATGGQSLPKSGSDGKGFDLARGVGHTIVAPVPALVPLLLAETGPIDHRGLSGVALPSELTIWVDGRVATRVTADLLWTHFGVSGPAALDASRHWTRATADGLPVHISLSVCPGLPFDALDQRLVDAVVARPRALLQTLLASFLPGAVAGALLAAAGLDPASHASTLTRDGRRGLAHMLVESPLPIVGTRGYTFAEATAGGVTLAEVDPRSMESRVCPGLFLVGEILDVDGRLGGFNFQWAWSSGATAARALAH
jgi:hypothetical protein